MSCTGLHTSRVITGGIRMPLGAVSQLRASPGRLSAAITQVRGMHGQVAATSTTTSNSTMVDLSYDAEQSIKHNSQNPADATYQSGAVTSARQLPMNFSPETRFTYILNCSTTNDEYADAQHFKLHPSVEFWANYRTRFNSRTLTTPDSDYPRNEQFTELANTVRELLSTSALADAESAAYWAYHLGRTGFFLGASASGAIAHHLAAQARALTSNSSAERTPFENLSANAANELSNRLFEAVAVYKQDLENIKQGMYKLPWDMTTISHRQYNPLFVLNKSAQFVSEAVATLNRRVAQARPDNWFSSKLYPKYYADNTFHYQSDGWFSDRSASVYEFSTEALFFGRQDAMQRTALLPLAEHIRAKGLDPAQMKVMEACCGTGRFHTFLKDNYPSMETICADLSPFYLARARENVLYWKSQKAPSTDLGGLEGTGTEFMQCAAEDMPVTDGSLDAVVCMYAFHEMPESARAAAASEMFRVLKPGGLAVLTDSVQLGDRPQWDQTLGAFGNFNEPHYRNFIGCDFGSLFKDTGFNCGTKYITSATKTLSFTKPTDSGSSSSSSSSGQHNESWSSSTGAAVLQTGRSTDVNGADLN